MQRSHGICMLQSGCQHDRSAPISDLLCLKSNQTRDGYVVGPCSLPIFGWYSPSGTCTEGIRRDLPIDIDPDRLAYGEDAQVNKAAELLE